MKRKEQTVDHETTFSLFDAELRRLRRVRAKLKKQGLDHILSQLFFHQEITLMRVIDETRPKGGGA